MIDDKDRKRLEEIIKQMRREGKLKDPMPAWIPPKSKPVTPPKEEYKRSTGFDPFRKDT